MVNLQQQRLILILCLLLACAALLSLLTGSASLPLYEALQQSFSEAEGVYGIILTELRLPRTLVAILAGASLGLSGAVMQSLLRNPLASPGLVGSASGAALGAVVSLYFGLSAVFTLALPLGGIGGALLATLTAYLLAGREAGPLTLILAGSPSTPLPWPWSHCCSIWHPVPMQFRRSPCGCSVHWPTSAAMNSG